MAVEIFKATLFALLLAFCVPSIIADKSSGVSNAKLLKDLSSKLNIWKEGQTWSPWQVDPNEATRKCQPGASDEKDISSYSSNVPGEIFIEVLVYLDQSVLSDPYPGEYSFWKTIDRYFEFFTYPKIRFRLIEMKVLKDAPFLIKNSLDSDRDKVNATGILNDFSEYAFTQRQSSFCHDVTLFITRSKLCSTDNQQCDLPAVAHPKGVCSMDNEKQQSKSVGVVHLGDTLYTKVKNILFAVGQLLGAPIDVNDTYGYFMSDTKNPDNYRIGWSRRSRDSIQKFLKFPLQKNQVTCLFNEPKPTWPSIYEQRYADLPGEWIVDTTYCQELTRNSESVPCNFDNERCQSLSCSAVGKNCSNVIREPAPEGLWCAADKRCQFGNCESWKPKKLWDKMLESVGLAS